MRLPLSNTLGNRDTSVTRDARLVNGYSEGDPSQGIARAVKRPAIVGAYSVTSGQGQGLWATSTPSTGANVGQPGSGVLVSVVGDILNNAPAKRRATIRFTVQPSSAGPGLAMSPAPVVTVYDVFGSVLTTYGGTVTIRLGNPNPANGILSGTVAVSASSGVATFSNLIVSNIGSYIFVASAA